MDERYIVKHSFILIGENLIFNAPLNKRLRIKNKNCFYEIEYDKNITLKLDAETFQKYVEPNVRNIGNRIVIECKGGSNIMNYVEVLIKCANGDTDICKHCDFERITMDTYGEYCGNVLMKRAAEYIEALETTLKMRKKGCEHCNQKCATCYWYSEFYSICDNGYDPEIDFYCNEEDGEYKGYIKHV